MELLINYYENRNVHEESFIKLQYSDVKNIVELLRNLESDEKVKTVEIEKCQTKIKHLLDDIDILEWLYKDSLEDRMQQANIIDSLRQSYLDHREEEVKWRTDIALLRESLKKCYTNIDISVTLQHDIEVIKGQLNKLQSLLMMDCTFDSSTNNTKCDRDIRKVTRKHCYEEKISRWYVEKFGKLCDTSKNQSLPLENFNTGNMGKEMKELKSVVATLQMFLTDSSNNFDKTFAQYHELVKFNASTNEQRRQERTTILWLESELHDSATKGQEICIESKQLFESFRNWLNIVKKERRNMKMKLKELHYVNTMLLRIMNNKGNKKN